MIVLSVENLTYDYVTKAGITHALQGVSAQFALGTLYAMTGRSGSGKSTFLSLLAGLDVPLMGEILFEGNSLTAKNLASYRRDRVGVIFQAYNLIPHLTAMENVLLSLEIAQCSKAERRNRARAALADVGLDETLWNKYPRHLSGGEQQRVAIARAIAPDPHILLADEPTGNLDNENSRNIVRILKQLAHERNKCVIVVTHSREIAEEADVEYRMSDGVLIG